MRPQNNRGFTLLELLIVIVVLSVLGTAIVSKCTGNSDSDASDNKNAQDCQNGNKCSKERPKEQPKVSSEKQQVIQTCLSGDDCLKEGSFFGSKGDLYRAGEFYSRACEFRNGTGCSKLGLFYEEGAGGYQQSFEKAAQYFEKACSYGEPNGCSNLASLYEDGRGGVQDNSRANALYEKSCKMKGAIGCYSLAHMYEKAVGVRQDLGKAKESYGLSCYYGFQPGCDAYKKMNQ